MIFLTFIMILSIGCSKNGKYNYNPTPYPRETAIKNGDIVYANSGGYNVSKLAEFIENVKKGKNDKIRITCYTTEGGAIITDLAFDGKIIYYTFDNTRDGFGLPMIQKKIFNSDGIYKKDSKYYLNILIHDNILISINFE
jgi:hypothetical protein